MKYSSDIIAELEILALFDSKNHQDGIKVHSTAEVSAIEAVERLYKKGFVTQSDGGYLTNMGLEAQEHAEALFTMLTTGSD